MTNNTFKAWQAGFTRRWHTHPALSETNDYNNGHQHRTTILLLTLFPESTRDAIIDAIVHDQGEVDAADFPAPIKHDNPDLAAISNKLESDSILAQGFPDVRITSKELSRRKFCDLLDSYLWMIRHKPYLRNHETWKQHLVWLTHTALTLDIPTQFLDMMKESYQYYGLGGFVDTYDKVRS